MLLVLTCDCRCSENELRQIFSRHGHVQTCIVNKDKRHAFVKMYKRQDAVHAKEAMEDTRNLDIPLRVSFTNSAEQTVAFLFLSC